MFLPETRWPPCSDSNAEWDSVAWQRRLPYHGRKKKLVLGQLSWIAEALLMAKIGMAMEKTKTSLSLVPIRSRFVCWNGVVLCYWLCHISSPAGALYMLWLFPALSSILRTYPHILHGLLFYVTFALTPLTLAFPHSQDERAFKALNCWCHYLYTFTKRETVAASSNHSFRRFPNFTQTPLCDTDVCSRGQTFLI